MLRIDPSLSVKEEMVRVEEISCEVEVTEMSFFKDVVFKNISHCLLVRCKHDVNLPSFIIRHLSSFVGVKSSFILVKLKQVVFALVKLPVSNKVGLASRI